eukprot:4779477-Pyramimonas_sp.AAC.1
MKSFPNPVDHFRSSPRNPQRPRKIVEGRVAQVNMEAMDFLLDPGVHFPGLLIPRNLPARSGKRLFVIELGSARSVGHRN